MGRTRAADAARKGKRPSVKRTVPLTAHATGARKLNPPLRRTTVAAAVVTRGEVSAAWGALAAQQGWEPQHTAAATRAGADVADLAFDRYDLAGTAHLNELVSRHGTMATSDLKSAQHPVLFQRVARPQRDAASPFLLDRYLSNVVRALVHPLHNFLQCHHSLHNADEVQVMLMPKAGPIAQADHAAHNTRRASSSVHRAADKGGRSSSPALRRCYVATNNETLTEADLEAAVAGWGVAGVFQVSEFVLVRGEKGRHAEQKLLEHLHVEVIRSASLHPLPTAEQKALIVGERLPCVVCRLFAIAYEAAAVLLPSHGHLYLSTLPEATNAAGESRDGRGSSSPAMYADPAAAAALLLDPKHRRVLH